MDTNLNTYSVKLILSKMERYSTVLTANALIPGKCTGINNFLDTFYSAVVQKMF